MKTRSFVNGIEQDVSAEFLRIWRSNAGKFAVREIKYKRRYYTGAAYEYEADWNTLRMSDFEQIESINQQLDTVRLNEYKTSNITLRIKNENNKWLPYNPLGMFGANSAGYNCHAYRTQFQVFAGYELADGSEELLPMFTGLLADYNASSRAGYIEFIVIGNEEKLQKADAQLVSDTFTDEATIPAAGDSINKVFATTSEGVDYISSVKNAGAVQTEFIAYKVGNNPVYGEGASITFTDAPNTSNVILASGRKWRINKVIDALAGYLCDVAGITEGNRTIEKVIFPNGVNGSKTIDTQAEWVAGGTKTNIDTDTTAGSIQLSNNVLDDFSSGDLTAWEVMGGSGFSVVSGCMQIDPTTTINSIRIPCTQAVGSWQFDFWQIGYFFVNQYCNIYILASNPHGTYGYPQNGYYLHYIVGGIQFKSASGTTLINLPGVSLSASDTVRLTRDVAGVFKLYINEVLRGTSAADLTYTTGESVYVTSFTTDDSYPLDFYLDNLRVHEFDSEVGVYPLTSEYISVEFDLLAAPTVWGILQREAILNSGTIAYYTAVSNTSGSGYDAYVQIGETGQILSNLKQFLMIKAVLAPDGTAANTPVLSRLQANFSSSTVFIALANFSGMTCYSALQKLAKLCGNELGFNGLGKLFFRSKNTSTTPVLTLDQNDIVEIPSIRPGWDAIINNGQIRYGNSNYYKEYSSDTLPEAHPRSNETFGECIASDTINDFLLANDADLATGAVQVLHDNNNEEKLRVKCPCKLIPHIELSDVIKVSFIEDSLKAEYVAGDALQKFGAFAFGQADGATALLYNRLFKVVGLSHNFENETTELNLLEVLV